MYEINKHYPFTELKSINEWGKTHPEYDINEYREQREYDDAGNEIQRVYDDYIVIMPRERELILQEQRRERAILLEAFDKWEKAVLRGREQDDYSIMLWYQDLLNLQDVAFTMIPERIKYYL